MKKKIHNLFKSLNIKFSDVIMLHVDSIVVTQLKNLKNNLSLIDNFINCLEDYFLPNGGIVVPTFSYSLNKNNIFDPLKTPSKVGMFSEKFRLLKKSIRSNHPIFSISILGSKAKRLLNSDISTSFGKNSFFDKFYKMNGKIVCMGCDLNRITFTHYVEQKLKVKYRYLKT